MIILGIETSCDETAASVVRNGCEILSFAVLSQIELHSRFGGVVPELASRSHVEMISSVVDQAIREAKIKKKDIDAVAVTRGPGLIGSLLVGFCFARAFAYSLYIPCIGVNHLEGHICSVFFNENPPEFPFVALLVSGGHTIIYNVISYTEYEIMGQTRDDAAGEAYDKVSKMLGLGYPGGKVIDDLAAKGDPEKILFPKPFLDKREFDFSFSGLKSAVARYIQTNKEYKKEIPDIAAGFQHSVIEVLSYKIVNAAMEKGCKNLVVAGGVAANRGLRYKVALDCKNENLIPHFPDPKLCGDNGAMIACVAYHYMEKRIFTTWEDDVYSRVSLDNSQ